jgi:hypothetical protein
MNTEAKFQNTIFITVDVIDEDTLEIAKSYLKVLEEKVEERKTTRKPVKYFFNIGGRS